MTSQIQVNLNPQSVTQMTHPNVAGQLQGNVKRREPMVPQWLGWSSQSLAYEFTQLEKTNQTTFRGLCPWPKPLPSAMAHTLWSVLFSES